AEMLAMPPVAPSAVHIGARRAGEGRLREHGPDRLRPALAQAPRIGDAPRLDQGLLIGRDVEQLARIGPERIDRVLRAPVALRRPVAQADHPFGRMAKMIGALLL